MRERADARCSEPAAAQERKSLEIADRICFLVREGDAARIALTDTDDLIGDVLERTPHFCRARGQMLC